MPEVTALSSAPSRVADAPTPYPLVRESAADQFPWRSPEEMLTLLQQPTYAAAAGIPEGTPTADIAAFVFVAHALRRNPLRRELYLIQRWDRKKNRQVYSIQMGIDGWRSVAHETGLCDGIGEPEYGYDDKGKVQWARVQVWRKGCAHPFGQRVYWAEYVQTTKDGAPTSFWRDMPHTMLGKCAEVAALRKAFPNCYAGVRAPEEMMQGELVEDAGPTAPPPMRRPVHKDDLAALEMADEERDMARALHQPPPQSPLQDEARRVRRETGYNSADAARQGQPARKATAWEWVAQACGAPDAVLDGTPHDVAFRALDAAGQEPDEQADDARIEALVNALAGQVKLAFARAVCADLQLPCPGWAAQPAAGGSPA